MTRSLATVVLVLPAEWNQLNRIQKTDPTVRSCGILQLLVVDVVAGDRSAHWDSQLRWIAHPVPTPKNSRAATIREEAELLSLENLAMSSGLDTSQLLSLRSQARNERYD